MSARLLIRCLVVELLGGPVPLLDWKKWFPRGGRCKRESKLPCDGLHRLIVSMWVSGLWAQNPSEFYRYQADFYAADAAYEQPAHTCQGDICTR